MATLDSIDRMLLAELQAEGAGDPRRSRPTRRADAPPCLRRVRSLEEDGVIKGYTRSRRFEARLGITVFAWSASEPGGGRSPRFEQHIKPAEVRECHMLNGEIDFILKIVSKDCRASRNSSPASARPQSQCVSVKDVADHPHAKTSRASRSSSFPCRSDDARLADKTSGRFTPCYLVHFSSPQRRLRPDALRRAGASFVRGLFRLEQELTIMARSLVPLQPSTRHDRVDVADAQGRVSEWRAETNAPVVLQLRAGRATIVTPGETITIEGWPSRDGKPYMRLRRATRADGSLIGSAPFGSQDQS